MGDGWRSEIGKKGDISDPGTSCPALVVAWRQKNAIICSTVVADCWLPVNQGMDFAHFVFTLCKLCFNMCVHTL